MVCTKSAASVGIEMMSRRKIAEGAGRMIERHAEQAHASLPERQHDDAEQQRRREIGGARVHGVNAMRRSDDAAGQRR